MKTRTIAFTLTCFLFLSGFAQMATAHPCGPPACPNCYRWNGEKCVPYGNCWGGCPDCYGCIDCYCQCTSQCCSYAYCDECYDCVNCSCECAEVVLYPYPYPSDICTKINSPKQFAGGASDVPSWLCTDEGELTWYAPGGDPDIQEGGHYFATQWATPGIKTVYLVTTCDYNSIHITVCDDTKNCCGSFCYDPDVKKCCPDADPRYLCDIDQECCDGNCCDPCNCETCVDGECKVCDGDPNQKCCDGCCISLSNGCEYAGAHDSSVHWTDFIDYYSLTVSPFGLFGAYPATYEVDFKYNNCIWVCEINDVNAETTILVRSPSSLPGMVSVAQASDVPCDDAELAKYDLDDTDLTDDIGAPRTKYWSNIATILHEQKHRSDWQEFYGAELDNAIFCSESLQSEIDCEDPNTITCQAAENYWNTWIQDFFRIAWEKALKKMNNPDTPVDEAEVRAYEVSYMIEHPISAALPGGCTP